MGFSLSFFFKDKYFKFGLMDKLQWGNRKKLRCVKVKESTVMNGKSDGNGIIVRWCCLARACWWAEFLYKVCRWHRSMDRSFWRHGPTFGLSLRIEDVWAESLHLGRLIFASCGSVEFHTSWARLFLFNGHVTNSFGLSFDGTILVINIKLTSWWWAANFW